jgi:acyl transferase domain-containing protein
MDVKSESKENENIKSQGPNSMKIAVIGMACNFPLAASKDEFWENLKSGRDCITEVKKSRWDKDKYFSPDYEKGKTYCKWGGFIDDIEYFDAKYFNIDEELATHIDPIARRFMEVSVQTFRDAGYEKDEIWGKKIGVFAGTRSGNYSSKISQPIKSTIIGTGQNFIAAHISHFFNLKGPNMVVDTACSSSLVSIHLACQSLINGESDMVLAGGADILLDERTYIVLSESGAISPDGKCHTFDERANGFVPGEGCGIVLLKPLKKAEEDGDNIYAVIEASAVNNDGHTMGITTPNPVAQETVIKEALEKAGVNASTVSYIEAHGTGTMIGDPIELKALTNVFREYTQEKGFCAIGSVKTNLGHLLSAAGVASFIKVVLSIINRQIPPTLNCKKPNPRFKFDQSPFYPNISLVEWKKLAGTRRAGISSFGFGGTNAHIILAEYERKDRQKKSRSPLPPIVFNRKRYWVDSGLKPIETENTGVSSSNQFIANITNTNKNLLLNDIPTVKQERILKIIDESDEFIENNQPDADNRKRILEIVDETDRD